MNDPRRTWNDALWSQFGAAIDMLGNAIAAFPDEIWADRSRRPEPWYLAFHTLFYLDLYLSGSLDGFAPPEPFTLSELDAAGVLPEHPYSRDEMLAYLAHCREKCRTTVAALDEETARRPAAVAWAAMPIGELHLYNLRHVQHGAGQLNLILRQAGTAVPDWVKATTSP